MNFVEMKKRLPIALIAGMLITGGGQCLAAQASNGIQTNHVYQTQNVQDYKQLKEEKAKEIAIKAFEKYFNKKIDAKNLIEKAKLAKADDEINVTNKDCWQVNWSTFDYSKFLTAKTTEDFKKLNEEEKKSITYYANIEAKTGEILEIGIIDRSRPCIKAKEIKTEDAAKITLEYIKNNKLADNTEELKLLGDIRIDADLCSIAYKYGENKVVEVFVESVSKNVVGFKYTDEKSANRGIQQTEDYKRTGVRG